MEPISVSERLPELTHKRGYCEFSDRVLVWSTQFGEWITGRYERDSGWKDDNEYCCEIEHVTHWLPLPPPPIVPQNGAESVTEGV